MHNRKRMKILAAVIIVGLGLAGCGGAKTSDTSGPVVATYTGGKIHEGEFQKQYNLQRVLVKPDVADAATGEDKKKFLEDYILDQKIVLAKAKESGVKVDTNQLNTTVSRYKNQIIQFAYAGDTNKFNEQMKKLGLADKDLTNLVETFLYLQQFQQEKLKSVSVTDEEIKKYYDDHRAAFADATVYHILTKTAAEAAIARERVLKGEDFSTVAKEVSIDPSAKQNGGKMEGPLSQYVAPFRDAAATLEIGKISEPVHTQFGYHIIKVEKRGAPEPFDKVKETIRQQLLTEKSEKTWDDYREDLRKTAKIQITLPVDNK